MEIRMNPPHNQWQLYIDGASRNNPGPSGVGIAIFKNGAPFLKEGFFVGIRTNNQAEYLALLIGMIILQQSVEIGDAVHIFSDSQLLVRQVLGEYKIKHQAILSFALTAKSIITKNRYFISHVDRSFNKEADAMANHGIDTAQFPSDDVQLLLRQQGIFL